VLEPDEGKLSSPVLREPNGRKAGRLPGDARKEECGATGGDRVAATICFLQTPGELNLRVAEVVFVYENAHEANHQCCRRSKWFGSDQLRLVLFGLRRHSGQLTAVRSNDSCAVAVERDPHMLRLRSCRG
jgi:hypothetical protein